MGAIKLPHASGNSMSIAAPATNPASDLTLTLPATTGTAGQVLSVNGSGNLTWVNPGWIKIATNTHSNVAQIDIEDTAAFDGTYDFVKVYLSDIRPANNNQMLLWRIKQGGSYVTSSNYNSHSLIWYDSTDTISHERAEDQTAGEWTTGTIGNAAADAFHAHLEFATPTATSYYPTFSWEGWGWEHGDNSMKISGSGALKVLGAFTGIRLYAVSGNLSAKVTTYGLTK